MSTERDELFQLICGRTTLKAVERVLAAGYRKPRQVTTVRELHALPDFSVVRSEYGAVFEKGGGWWAETGTRDKSLAVDIALPATVLHVGGAE